MERPLVIDRACRRAAAAFGGLGIVLVRIVGLPLVFGRAFHGPFLDRFAAELEIGDSTTLIDGGRRNTGMLTAGGVTADFLFDHSTGASWPVLSAALQSSSQQVVTGFQEGSTIGSPALLCSANTTKLTPPAKAGTLLTVQGYFKSEEDGVDFGVSLHANVAETGTWTSAGVDNGAATTNGGVAVIHVTSIAGGSPSVVVKIQHSADSLTWSDLLTFTTVAGLTKERIEVSGTVNRYVRCVGTFSSGTSITPVVAFARR